jgi:sporulation-control protein spo0M
MIYMLVVTIGARTANVDQNNIFNMKAIFPGNLIMIMVHVPGDAAVQQASLAGSRHSIIVIRHSHPW